MKIVEGKSRLRHKLGQCEASSEANTQNTPNNAHQVLAQSEVAIAYYIKLCIS